MVKKINSFAFGSSFLVPLIAALFVFAGLSTFASLDSRQNPYFDVYDEGAHFDYVVNLKNFTIPFWGTLESQDTLLIGDCLGRVGGKQGSCETKDRDPGNFAPGGFSYQAQQPPLGYFPYIFAETKSTSPLDTLQEMRRLGIFFWSTLIALLVAFIVNV